MRIIVLKILVFFAVTGFTLSTLFHLCSLFQLVPLGSLEIGIGFGVFIIWIPVFIAMNRLSEGFPRKDLWKAALRGCPNWLKITAFSSLSYIILNIIISLATGVEIPGHNKTSPPVTPAIIRSSSTFFMGFYALGSAILVSALKIYERNQKLPYIIKSEPVTLVNSRKESRHPIESEKNT